MVQYVSELEKGANIYLDKKVVHQLQYSFPLAFLPKCMLHYWTVGVTCSLWAIYLLKYHLRQDNFGEKTGDNSENGISNTSTIEETTHRTQG